MTPVILLVEDNPTDEKLTLRAFERSRVAARVVVVRDGAEALDYLFGTGAYSGREPQTYPAVVLLDLKLPRVDGLEVIRRVRTDPRTAFLPIVVLTASREAEDVLHSYSFGANAYVRKPVDFAQFVDTVHTIGTFWVRVNERAGAAPLTASDTS